MSRVSRRRREPDAHSTADEAHLGTDPQHEVIPPEVATSLRYMLERIQLNTATGLPRKLAFTSALSGEGVTFISRSLGVLIARDLDRAVCVVDLNWWSRPRHAKDTETPLGLANVIENGTPIDEIIVPSELHNLSVIPAGQSSMRRRSLLANSAELGNVIQSLTTRFDHLILDLPAVLLTSDALTLARLSDAVALVVRQGVTTDTQVKAAADELRGVVSLGVVLNRCTSHIPKRIRQLVGG